MATTLTATTTTPTTTIIKTKRPKQLWEEKRMLNFDEIAHYIGLAPQTVRNQYYAGKFPIPSKKIFSKVLWDIKDVDKYLDRLTKIEG